jgi:hypothetical protein
MGEAAAGRGLRNGTKTRERMTVRMLSGHSATIEFHL